MFEPEEPVLDILVRLEKARRVGIAGFDSLVEKVKRDIQVRTQQERVRAAYRRWARAHRN